MELPKHETIMDNGNVMKVEQCSGVSPLSINRQDYGYSHSTQIAV